MGVPEEQGAVDPVGAAGLPGLQGAAGEALGEGGGGVVHYFPDKRRRDADNYAGKFLLDGLTKAGVIVDDDLKHITTIIIGRYDKNDPRTEITVYGKDGNEEC